VAVEVEMVPLFLMAQTVAAVLLLSARSLPVQQQVSVLLVEL
jgi:hypothetical protein